MGNRSKPQSFYAVNKVMNLSGPLPTPVPCCFLQFYLFSSFAGLVLEPTLLRAGRNWQLLLKKKTRVHEHCWEKGKAEPKSCWFFALPGPGTPQGWAEALLEISFGGRVAAGTVPRAG